MMEICRRTLFLTVTLSLVLLLVACGGGGGDSVPQLPIKMVRIESPSASGAYQTDAATVRLEGDASVPTGSSCDAIFGTLPPGYWISWSTASISNFWTDYKLFCLLWPTVVWRTGDIPLNMGANSIIVTATYPNGRTEHDTIIVTRVADITPPNIISTSPSAGATNISTLAKVIVTFNEAMDSATISTSNLILKDSLNNTIPATVFYDAIGKEAWLTPTNTLAYNSTYRVTVTAGIHDASSNPLAADYNFSFTTSSSPDITPPTVQFVSPAGGSICAATTNTVTATFNEDLNPSSVNGGTFTLTGPTGPVGGTISYANQTAFFAPSTSLTLASAYTASLTTGITDLAGNQLSPYQWSFTTYASMSGVGSWLPTNFSNAPYARYDHIAVWAGDEMIIAGGLAWDSYWGRFDYTSQYGRYNPATDVWTVGSGAPTAVKQRAVWTGSQILAWGGYNSGSAVTAGSRYSPTGNSWIPMAISNQPSPRFDHTIVWTGSEMIVWGGRNSYGGTEFNSGKRYDPVTDSWRDMSMIGAPSARYGHTAVWTGTEMIIWGGISSSYLVANGARYNPTTDTWTAISNIGAPTGRDGHIAIWAGSKMMIWGDAYGSTNIGGLYDPAIDAWAATDISCAPSGRGNTVAIWTGSRVIIWGGAKYGSYLDDGYEYDPITNTWVRITMDNAPPARAHHTAIWTGNKVIVWGGSNGGVMNSGSALVP